MIYLICFFSGLYPHICPGPYSNLWHLFHMTRSRRTQRLQEHGRSTSNPWRKCWVLERNALQYGEIKRRRNKCPKLSKTQMLTAKHWLFPAYPEMVFFAAELRKLPKWAVKKKHYPNSCTHKGLSRILSFYFRGHNAGFRETTATTTSFAGLSRWKGKSCNRGHDSWPAETFS